VPSTSAFLAFGLTSFVLIAVPGPSVLFTISRALTVGRRDALLTVVGNAVGEYVLVVAVAFGVGALVQRSVEALTAIKGAVYLIYLGVQAIRRRRSVTGAFHARVTPKRIGKVLIDGFVVGVANPKTAVFLVAALPQFLGHAVGNVPVQILILGSLFPAIGLLTDSVWAFIAGTARSWFARSPRRLGLIGGTGGLVMIGLGVSVAVSGRKD
jgi:threonine/homoserine/homoserine lactone efflux protein